MTECYLGLGSNLRSPQRQLRQALLALRTLPRSAIVAQSSIYSSVPCGIQSQPIYCNMVVKIHTSLPPLHLLTYCQRIENKFLRIRKKHWGARTLDIDLLLFGSRSMNHHQLSIPHPHMLTRDFVLLPLLEISPTAVLPNGEAIMSFLDDCRSHVITKAPSRLNDGLLGLNLN